MERHTNQQQCLEVLTQTWTDGGAQEYVQQSRGPWDVREAGEGYCAIAALVHAQLLPPTGQAYKNAKSDLEFQQRNLTFHQRMVDETTPHYLLRRLKQFFVKPTFNASDGTPSHAILRALDSYGYQVIYPNRTQAWHCICDPRCLYVLDVLLPDGGHTFTVHGGIAHMTAPFNPTNTQVLNVYRLPPTETREIIALRKYEEDYQEWHDNMEDSFRNQVPLPKLEDYLD